MSNTKISTEEYGTQMMPRFDTSDAKVDYKSIMSDAQAKYYDYDIGLIAMSLTETLNSSGFPPFAFAALAVNVLDLAAVRIISIPEIEKQNLQAQEDMMEALGYTGANFFDTFYDALWHTTRCFFKAGFKNLFASLLCKYSKRG